VTRRRSIRAQRALTAALVGGAALLVSLTVGARPALADTVFSDGFESGDFSAWTQVQTGGDGKAAVQSAIVRTGAAAAQLSETSNSGSKAYVRKTFAAAQLDLTASGDFQVVQPGASGGNVPFFRFLDASSARVISLYRQNDSNGTVGLTFGGTHVSTTGRLALGTWANLSLHTIVNGTASTVEVRMNGTLVYQSTTASLGTAGVSTVQLGNDTAAQAFNLVADTIVIQNPGSTAPSPPVNTAPPAISGTPQSGQTLTASTGTWTGTQPIGYAYQWQRCDTTGAGCSPVSGAVGSTYAVTSADVGSTLRVVVTATNATGSASSTSAATTVVQPASAAPVNSSPPAITGTARDGQLLNASPGTWTGTQPITYAYQWQRCDTTGSACNAIGGATGASYPVTSADVGSTLRVVVTAANSAGSATATSNATAVVQASSSGTGIVALWHMDETSGSTMFDSARTHNGALHSIKLGLPGFAGLAYGFNGSSSYVSVPSASDLNPSASNITITIHLNTTGTPPPPPADWDVIRKGLYTTAGGEFKMEFQQTGKASCGFKGSGGYAELISGPAINNGQWHTIQCVKTASAIKLIVDGQTFSQAANVGSIANTTSVVVGARPGSDWYKGSLDEASIQVG
jgi:concanavalin A-like lectin/glucanase superfamily protein